MKTVKNKDMRRQDKKEHMKRVNLLFEQRCNEEKFSWNGKYANEDVESKAFDDLATHQERFSDQDFDMDDRNSYDSYRSQEVIKHLMNGREVWNLETKLGFRNTSTSRAFYFQTDKKTGEIYFEVETNDGNILDGFITHDGEYLTLYSRNKKAIKEFPAGPPPEVVANILTFIKKNETIFRHVNETVSEDDTDDYNYPYNANTTTDKDENYKDPYEIKDPNENIMLGDDLEVVKESDCDCKVDETDTTDVENSIWFSDVDGERLMDKNFN
jgi:hypothetical protein